MIWILVTYVPIVINKEERLQYYQVLDHAHVKGDHEPFVAMVAELEVERLRFYVNFLS